MVACLTSAGVHPGVFRAAPSSVLRDSLLTLCAGTHPVSVLKAQPWLCSQGSLILCSGLTPGGFMKAFVGSHLGGGIKATAMTAVHDSGPWFGLMHSLLCPSVAAETQ